jgi:phage tail sheath protein FI
MPEYLEPGVFIEEVAPPRSIEGVSTSTALFLGHATTGPLDRTMRVTSFAEYERTFGGIADLRAVHDAHPDLVADVDHLGHAVLAYFDNGGRTAFVRRLSTDGHDPLPVRDPAAFSGVLGGLDVDPDAREVSVVVTPGLAWDALGRPILETVIGRCARSGRRLAIIDLPPNVALAGPRAGGAIAGGLPETSFAAAYHPWLVVANPVHDPVARPDAPATVTVPPSGFIAGLYARTDLERGVFKAPAGPSASLRGVLDLAGAVGARQPAPFGRAGVNAIRSINGGVPIAWGTRTLAPGTEPDWKYVPVRRLGIFLERSIDEGTQFAVFEPNAEPLWAELSRIVEPFLTQVWRAGAFAGTRSQEAFFVRCGLGETMTQSDLDHGTAILEVGFAPLRPAEFIIFRFAIATASAV